MKEIEGSSVEQIVYHIVENRCDSFRSDVVHDGRFMGVNHGKCFVWLVCASGTHIATNENPTLLEHMLKLSDCIRGIFFINDATKRIIEFGSIEELTTYLSMTGAIMSDD